jgi:hypothetical protein
VEGIKLNLYDGLSMDLDISMNDIGLFEEVNKV